MEGTQAGFRAATGHQGTGRAAPQERPGSRPTFLKLRAGIMWFLSSFPSATKPGGKEATALSCTGRRWSCDCPCALLFTLLWVVGLTIPLSGGPAWLGTLPSTLTWQWRHPLCPCEVGAWSHCLGWFTSGGGRGAQSSGQVGPPESPAASGPLSGLSAAGVSSPRKGLALSSPPSEASTPVNPGDRAQVGSCWGSGGWVRRGDSCHC